MGPDDWWNSKLNRSVPKINLDPKKRPKTNLAHFNDELLNNRSSSITLEAKSTENNLSLNPIRKSDENVSIGSEGGGQYGSIA